MEALFSENEAVPDAGADIPSYPSHTLANNAGTSLSGTYIRSIIDQPITHGYVE